MIVVTGATGALNGATVDRLLERMPADEIAVAVREKGKADGSRIEVSRSGTAITPIWPHCPVRSKVPISCCWSPPATRPRMR